jgi:hypothetical protein
MLATDKGELFRSEPITYSSGASRVLDMSFLHNPMNKMKAPVVREILLAFTGDISGISGGFDNEDGAAIFSQIRIADRGGEIYRMPGKISRVEQQMELGASGDEVDGLADAASAATTSGDNMLLRIPWDMEFAKDGAETALPLLHLVAGGILEMTFGTPAESTGVSGAVTVYVVVHDEKRRELKGRLIRRSLAVVQRDTSYPIGGSVRQLHLTSNPATEGMSPWTTSTYTALNIPELDLAAFRSYLLKEEYKRLRCSSAQSAADEINAGNGIPLIVPSRGQRIDKMPDLKSIHIDLGSDTVPTSAQLAMSYIEDRDQTLAAEWLGYSSVAQFQAAHRERGYVRVKNGPPVKATEFPGTAARRMAQFVEGAGGF